jgi:hypothetical protein
MQCLQLQKSKAKSENRFLKTLGEQNGNFLFQTNVGGAKCKIHSSKKCKIVYSKISLGSKIHNF